MVSLKWSDVLSTLLPGTLALIAIAPWVPLLDAWIGTLDQAGIAVGFTLLIFVALVGGFLEAVTRILWEKHWLIRQCRPPSHVLKLLKENPHYLNLYERSVQSSYKYVTFYSNFGFAAILLFSRNLLMREIELFSAATVVYVIVIFVLFSASHVQWGYYVNSQNKIFDQGGALDVEERPAAWNENQISESDEGSKA